MSFETSSEKIQDTKIMVEIICLFSADFLAENCLLICLVIIEIVTDLQLGLELFKN